MPISPQDVREAYRVVLGREAESDAVVDAHAAAHRSILALVKAMITSAEFRTKQLAVRAGPYRASFDVHALLAAFATPGRPTRAGFITDWVGSVTDSRFIRGERTDQPILEGAPVPRNFHADEAEWGACLRAVDLAAGQFTAIELGAGWAPWLVSCTLAARRHKGIRQTHAVAVEADGEHVGYAEAHFRNNRFSADSYQVIEAAAGPRAGFAVVPIPTDSSADWGLRPQYCETEAEADLAASQAESVDYRGYRHERVRKLPVVTLQDLLSGMPVVDLVHIDVQGDEYDIVAAATEPLRQQVRYLVIGTHARSVEVNLFDLLSRNDWILEVEKPCEFALGAPDYPLTVDGTQGWRNARL